LAAGCAVGLGIAASAALADPQEDCDKAKEKPDLAIKACSQLIRHNPRDAVAYVKRGLEERHCRRSDRSERQQGAALRLTKPPVDLAGRLLQQNLPTTTVVGATPCPSVWIKALHPIDGFCLVRRRCFLSHAARRNLG